MKKFLLILLALAVSVVGGVSAHAANTTINFDVDALANPITAPFSFTGAVALTDLYSALGVTFGGSATGLGGAILTDSTFGRPALSGSNILAFNSSAVSAHFPENIYFASAIGYVEIWMAGSYDVDTVTMTAYDASGNVLGTSTVASQDWARLSVFSPGIAKVTLDRIAGTGGTEFDNLTFGDTRPVPVPATILLLGPGLVGLAAIRRRFKK
jgi:hypothetical protein